MGRRIAPDRIEADDGKVVMVWDVNFPAVRVFLALATQWRVATLTTLERARVVRIGLDYAAIPVVLAGLGIKRSRSLFARLQVLEREALAAFHEAA